MALPTITELARVVADSELRYTQQGTAVASVRLAFNKPKFDKSTGKWEDDKTFYVKGTVWEDAAERASQQLVKGAEVFVTGEIETQEWEQDGQKRSAPALTIRRFKVVPKAPQPQGFAPSPQGESFNPQQAPADTSWGQVAQPGQGFDGGVPF